MRWLWLLMLATPGFAADPFFQDKEIGWFWYKERQAIQQAVKDPVTSVEEEKEELDRLLKVAIKAPTESNLIEFIKLRNKIIDQSYKFGLKLQQVNLMHPNLDQLSTYPTNNIAKELYKTAREEKIEQKIAMLAKTHGLFYVFESRCPHCHAFAPTVKNFAHKYGWSVLAITLDGIPIREFPDARVDNGMARKLNIKNIPALIMVEPKTAKILPIAIGVVSEEEIIDRIDLLTRESL